MCFLWNLGTGEARDGLCRVRAVLPPFLPFLHAAFLGVLPEKIYVLWNCNLQDFLGNTPQSANPLGLLGAGGLH